MSLSEKAEEFSRKYHVTREKVESLFDKISAKLLYKNPAKFMFHRKTLYESTYEITDRYLQMKMYTESKLEKMIKPSVLE